MSHYEQRLENDLNRIRESLISIAGQVETALKDSVHALMTGNDKLAHATALGDKPINRAIRELDRQCHGFVALHLPSAGHLRFVSSVMRMGIELERVGDYAVTISRESVQLGKPPEGIIAREVELMADESAQMLNQAIEAFKKENADMARATMAMADQVERTFETVFEDLSQEGGDTHPRQLFAHLVIFNMLERVSDQAKNICEEIVFAVTGETKPPKMYKILFLDEDNASRSQMAEAIARKTFPNSGIYGSAGRTAAKELHEGTVSFLAGRGVDITGAKPKALEPVPHELAQYHVLVSLQGAVKDYVKALPFHTAALEWDLGQSPASLDGEASVKRLEEIYREMALQVRDLMETLRGVGAS